MHVAYLECTELAAAFTVRRETIVDAQQKRDVAKTGRKGSGISARALVVAALF